MCGRMEIRSHMLFLANLRKVKIKNNNYDTVFPLLFFYFCQIPVKYNLTYIPCPKIW